MRACGAVDSSLIPSTAHAASRRACVEYYALNSNRIQWYCVGQIITCDLTRACKYSTSRPTPYHQISLGITSTTYIGLLSNAVV